MIDQYLGRFFVIMRQVLGTGFASDDLPFLLCFGDNVDTLSNSDMGNIQRASGTFGEIYRTTHTFCLDKGRPRLIPDLKVFTSLGDQLIPSHEMDIYIFSMAGSKSRWTQLID